jgi:membrane-bound lytic murein transglycosylase B
LPGAGRAGTGGELNLLAIIGSAVLLATAPPAPSQPVPADAPVVAAALARTTRDLHVAVDRWRFRGEPSRGRAPLDVTLFALYQQRIYRLLSREERLARATLARLPEWLTPQARDTIAARRALSRLTPPTTRRLRSGPALPAGVLLLHYREAQRRFGVNWQMLAAVNFVESAFGRVRSLSPAGAQGPMQFIPSTWRRYGLGGNVHDPHDAILGAANYLHANGAPRRAWAALYRYNPSPLYVEAVLRYTRQMTRDVRAYYAYYSWQVFVRTPQGDRRVTGPGLG